MAEPNWQESHAAGEGRAINHALVEWMHAPAGLVIKVNGKPALRVAIKYRETGPYLAVEADRANDTRESYAACERAGRIAQRYDEILKAHNALGELLQSGRQFLIQPISTEKSEAA